MGALEHTLDRLTDEARLRPFIAVIESRTGKTLLLGLGRDNTVVQYQASANPPYYASVGDPGAFGVVVFDYDGQETEFDRRHLVSIAAGRRAVAEFVTRDELPPSLRWEGI